MPIYPVINRETGEKKELTLTIPQWEEWKEENYKDGWDRDWDEGCASVGEVGDWRDKLDQKHPSWKEVLKRADKSAGSKSQMNKRA